MTLLLLALAVALAAIVCWLAVLVELRTREGRRRRCTFVALGSAAAHR